MTAVLAQPPTQATRDVVIASCISGVYRMPQPDVRPELGFAEQVKEILQPLVTNGHLTDKEVQLLVKLGPDSYNFNDLLDRPKAQGPVTPAQVRQCEFLSEIASHAINGVFNSEELRTALFTPAAAQKETLQTIEHMLVVKQLLAQAINQGSFGPTQWENMTSGEGLIADCDRLMSKAPGMHATLTRFLARTEPK